MPEGAVGEHFECLLTLLPPVLAAAWSLKSLTGKIMSVDRHGLIFPAKRAASSDPATMAFSWYSIA